MRFEFVEVVVRIAIAKCGNSELTPAATVEKLMTDHVVPNINPLAQIEPDKFRSDRLYQEPVHILYKEHLNLLKAVYSRFRLPPRAGGLRSKLLGLDGWMELM